MTQPPLFETPQPYSLPGTHVDFLVAFLATWALGQDVKPKKAEREELERIARQMLLRAADLRRDGG